MGEIFATFIIEFVLPLLGVIFATVCIWGMKRLSDRFGVEIGESHLRQVRDIAYAAVAFTEERAANYARKIGNKYTSEQKLAMAVGWLLEQLPALTYEDAEKYIEAALAISGIGAARKGNVEEQPGSGRASVEGP